MMKIPKHKIHRVADLTEEIKAVNLQIERHRLAKDNSSIINQYEHRKLKFINELIGELVTIGIESKRIFSMIRKIMDSVDQNYLSHKQTLPTELDENLNELDSVI